MVYFLSDVHLGNGPLHYWQDREELLIALLEMIASSAEQLFIVGDLFDYWFEYRTVLPRAFFRTLAALDRLRKRGVTIEYLIGNHDFGHHDFFERELDITIHWNDHETSIANKRFYIAHGDGKVAGDWGYTLLRTLLRNRITNTLYRWLHPDIGIWLASQASRRSRHYTEQRHYEGDSLLDFAERKICQEGCDYVVMGHRHQALIMNFVAESHTGTYVNLGDWMSQPRVGIFDGEHFELADVRSLVITSRP